MANLPWGVPVQITRDGKVMRDQPLALRLFKDAANVKERYRIIFKDGKWIVYHCGRRIYDSVIMMRGAVSPGVLIDEIRRIRGW